VHVDDSKPSAERWVWPIWVLITGGGRLPYYRKAALMSYRARRMIDA